MLSSKVVAVLVAAALVQAVTAFPMEAKTLDHNFCETAMLRATPILRGLSEDWEILPHIIFIEGENMKACKGADRPQDVPLSDCEKGVKIMMGYNILMMFESEFTKVDKVKAALAEVALCRPQSHLLVEGLTDMTEVQPRDLNTCLVALDESRGLLAELSKLMQDFKRVEKLSLPEKIQKCNEAGLVEDCDLEAMADIYDELRAILNNLLKLKDAGQDTFKRLDQCMYV